MTDRKISNDEKSEAIGGAKAVIERMKATYTLTEIEDAFFNHDSDGSERSSQDYEQRSLEWKSFANFLTIAPATESADAESR